ncbi:AraC family transcriptional regulator [Rhizobium sp. BK376]|uniref:AraC family transcriptional regulator n=1 Tax=Rhizobium sp. BK376 TaxID=2512149 RepID=UPI00104ED99E|nr:AraC family transcriptional regulator [Rhizobium sp. BK376]TCR92628.1 AraC family transcriptional regulator [Rhizobium sp. BK376]
MAPHDSNNGVLAPASDNQTPTDLLSDILRFVQLKGERVFTTECADGFHILFRPSSACLHVVQEGEIDIYLEDEPPLRLSQGDVFVLLRPIRYALACPSKSWRQANHQHGVDGSGVGVDVLRDGIGPVRARTLSATFQFENGCGLQPTMSLLPNYIHVEKNTDQSAVLIRDVAQFLVYEKEAQEPGAALMISRVIDILVIRSIRSWSKSQGGKQGWIGALADARVSRALSAVHRNPSRPWSVGDLASIAGMSRSRFAGVFLAAVGEPPLRYVHGWRLAVASDLLRKSNLRIGDIARHVGYDSEAAFSRAFKTLYGLSPSHARSSGTN